MALVIAGERSGVGKTTVTLALLAYLCRRNFQVQSFKVGPDYIDPMFHQFVTGRSCRNLDPVLTSEAYVKQCFSNHLQGMELALVEGVMGLFDGVRLPTNAEEMARPDFASTAHIARLLNLPILLVIDCGRVSGSVAAIAHGYCTFDPRIQCAGVVLNRVGSERHLELLQNALEPLQIPILGVLNRQDHITIPDRYLGLVPTDELNDKSNNLNSLINLLADLGASCFDWEKLLPLLAVPIAEKGGGEGSEQLSKEHSFPTVRLSTFSDFVNPFPEKNALRIAIARDKAFNFYYSDNLDCLEQLGAELVFWSPLVDPDIPKDIHGLYFGGGFPEIFAEELSQNAHCREALKVAILQGMPTYAECGGLMYLCEQITDFKGKSWSMVGVVPATAIMGKRLTLGYRQALTLRDTPILKARVQVYGHEFHRSHLSVNSPQPLYQLQSFQLSQKQAPIQEGWQLDQLHASYLHLHWGTHPEIPIRFLEHCTHFAQITP